MSKVSLGKLLEPDAKRDATHIAVAPVVCGEALSPGSHVNVRDGVARTGTKTIGIIDPFLRQCPKAGERVWVYMYPNTIEDLRHDWSHPAFPDSVPPTSDEKIEQLEDEVRRLKEDKENPCCP